MRSKEIMYSKGSNDECYTPKYGVLPILPYIPENWVVWCPFDTSESWFVMLISKTNKVIYTHIDDGKDFYTHEPDEHWDCIVSNPPYSNKRKIFERAMSFNKPFALLMTATWWNDSALNRIFSNERPCQILKPDKRIEYDRKNGVFESSNNTFLSMYYCYRFLPQDIMFCEIEKPKKHNRKGFVDCEKCGGIEYVFYDKDLPSICDNCLPNNMCESCNGFNIEYQRTVAGGELLCCNDCYHEQYKR